MNRHSSPQNSLTPAHPNPSPEKSKQFSTPPSNNHATKDAKWLNQRIAKKEFKSLYERGLQTVSKKLIFEEQLTQMNYSKEAVNPDDSFKILKLR